MNTKSELEIDFIVPGSIDQLTGGYIYDKNIVNGMKKNGCRVSVKELDGSFPFIDSIAEKHAQEIWGSSYLKIIDGLALPAFSKLLLHTNNVVALVHHPLCKETGLTQKQQDELYREEKNNLQQVKHIITTSSFTKSEIIEMFSIAEDKISVVIPGNHSIAMHQEHHNKVKKLLCVASLTSRKGYDVLFDALAKLKDVNWELNCIGSLQRDPETVSKIINIAKSHNLTQQIHFCGEVSRKQLEQLYVDSDIFVLASYYEGYGMAISEALYCGLPIVATTGGAISHILNTKNALLCSPGNTMQLADCLYRLIISEELRSELRQEALNCRAQLPSWQQVSTQFATIVLKLGV